MSAIGPRIGEHIRWLKFSKGDARFWITYYDGGTCETHSTTTYRPGEEGEGYLTVFVKPVKGSPGCCRALRMTSCGPISREQLDEEWPFRAATVTA